MTLELRHTYLDGIDFGGRFIARVVTDWRERDSLLPLAVPFASAAAIGRRRCSFNGKALTNSDESERRSCDRP